MNIKSSIKKLLENQAVFRKRNEKLQKAIDNTNKLAIEHGQTEYIIKSGPFDPPLQFFCECADENCKKRVAVNHHEYNAIHKNRRQFVVKPGHQTDRVEKVVRKKAKYLIVEKIFAVPENPGELNATPESNA